MGNISNISNKHIFIMSLLRSLFFAIPTQTGSSVPVARFFPAAEAELELEGWGYRQARVKESHPIRSFFSLGSEPVHKIFPAGDASARCLCR